MLLSLSHLRCCSEIKTVGDCPTDQGNGNDDVMATFAVTCKANLFFFNFFIVKLTSNNNNNHHNNNTSTGGIAVASSDAFFKADDPNSLLLA